MILTRATDNRLKTFFTGGEVRYGDAAFQGKGFRSLGQEAIYAAGIRLRRGAAYRGADGRWKGDVIGPVIRDLGVTLAMRPEPDTVRMVLNAQMGKVGAPLDGKDLHIGDFEWGILPPAAPLTTATLTIAGHGDGVLARRIGPRRDLVHRRRRIVARRMARGDQPVRGAPAAGDLLRREQPDGALDAGRASSRPCACSPTRPPATASPASRSTAPIPTRSPRRSPGRPSARAPGSGPTLIEPVADAHVRPRASRRHAVSRPRSAAVVGAMRRSTEQGYADRELYEYWAGARSDRALCGAARGGRHHRRRAISIASSAKPRRWSKQQARAVDRRAVARAGSRRASACSRTSRRARTSRCSIPRSA